MNKIVLFLLRLPEMIHNCFELRRKHVKYGNDFAINGKIYLHGQGSFVFGDGVRINSGARANPAAGDGFTHINVLKEGHLIVGNNVGISNVAITVAGQIEIGDNAMIGAGCVITDTDFHPLDYKARVSGDDSKIKIAPVTVGEGAFIGARCIILKGSKIGKHAIIGAGSVVTGDIPDGEVWAGNPARKIR